MRFSAYIEPDVWRLTPCIEVWLERDISKKGIFDGLVLERHIVFSWLVFNLAVHL